MWYNGFVIGMILNAMKRMLVGDTATAVAIVIGAIVIGVALYFGLRDPEPPTGNVGDVTIVEPTGEIPPSYRGNGTPEMPPAEPGNGTGMAIPPEMPVSAEDMIRDALVAKTGIPEDELDFSVGENTEWIARGTVRREGEPGGAGFFAAKDMEGVWIVTYVGQGVPECDEVNPYGYPTTWADYCMEGGVAVPR